MRVPGKETAQACADRIIADVIAFANAEKNNFVRYTLQVNKNISTASMVNTDAKLTAPVRISDRPVSPRTWHLLIGLALFGLLLGCVFDWLRYLYISRNHLEASDWAPGANS